MFINDQEFYDLVKKGAVQNDERDFVVEAGGLDLTVGALYTTGRCSTRNMGGFVGRRWRKLPEQQEYKPTKFDTIPIPILECYGITREERKQLIDTGTEYVWPIESGIPYTVKTAEVFNTPIEEVGLLGQRRTLIMVGSILVYTFVSPGFGHKKADNLKFALHHFGPSFLLEVGAPIVAYRLVGVRSGKIKPYETKILEGDKVTTDGLEVGS